MRIADVCTHLVVSTQATVSVREAAEAMRQHHVGALVVVEKPNGERIPVGIVTDRDIVVAVVATGGNPDKLTLGQIMSKPVATCTESEGLFAAILTMREHGVRRLPVLNAKGGLAGMVSADDIYGALGAQMVDLGEALAREETREMQERR
jgi:CBS domain-containing protein